MFKVQDAQREKLVGAIGVMGPSGAGKTNSSLFLAFGMMKAKYPDLPDADVWKKVGFVDTEHKRGLIYSNMVKAGVTIGSFKYIDFPAPFSPDRYEGAVQQLKKSGAEVIILDSISHAWDGAGGLLEIQEKNGGRAQDWSKTNVDYRKFIDTIVGVTSGVHIISTMRSEQAYAMESVESESGRVKLEVKKLGLKPKQRESLEYEFQITLALDMEHQVRAVKDNSDIFQGEVGFITVEHGKQLYNWLEEGKDIFEERRKQEEAEEAQRQDFIGLIRGLEKEVGETVETAIKNIETHKSVNMNVEQMGLEWLEKTYNVAKMRADEWRKVQEEAKKQASVTEDAVAKAKEKAANSHSVFKAASYFYHAESDSYLSFKKGDKIPTDPDFEICVGITKAEYEAKQPKQHA